MRTLTTDWNNASYASATTFLDTNGGAYVTIPANNPDKVRSMQDSVSSGEYAVLADNAVPATIVADSVADAESVAALATTTVVVSVDGSAAASAGVGIAAVSANTARFTVSPAYAVADANGEATFTITGVAAGAAANLTFSVGSNPALTKVVAVTVT